MSRPPRGKEVLLKAQQQLTQTNDATELRVLQAVVFPLLNGMTTQETARAVGRSPRWVTLARNRYIREAGIWQNKARTVRNHAHMSLTEEKEFLAPFLGKARCGGMLVVNEIHRAMEEHLGRKVALASAYNLLHRHGWRKLAPDKRSVEADVQAQEDWKKTSGTTCPHQKRVEKARASPVDVSGRKKICKSLECDIGDIMEILPDEPEEKPGKGKNGRIAKR